MKWRDTSTLPMIERIEQEVDIYGQHLRRERDLKEDFISAAVNFQSNTQKYHAPDCDCFMCQTDRDILAQILT